MRKVLGGFKKVEPVTRLRAFWLANNMGGNSQNSASYWREAYETLVSQTGRNLNDGLGVDPRTYD